MIKSILYKEWIKSYKILAFILLIFVGFIIYTFIDIAMVFRVNGAMTVWSNIILKDIVLVSKIEYIPLLAAIMLSASQYIPEMLNKKIKLTLHLPLKEGSIVSSMLLYGVLALTLVYLLVILSLVIGLQFYFTHEYISANFSYILPWFLGGIIAYFLSSWVILEPNLKYKMITAVISVCLLSIFYLDAPQHGYTPMFAFIGFIILLAYKLPFNSIVRFKRGIQ